MTVYHDVVRPFQSPDTAPGIRTISQYNLVSHPPVVITPGRGSGGVQSIPLQTSHAHFRIEITYYVEAAAVEAAQNT